MDLGENLYNLRKKKNLSQEEVAEKLNVTRQTISKWETGESKPDFDKIIPICNLYDITSDELLKGEITEPIEKEENKEIIDTDEKNYNNKITKKRAFLLSLGIFLYFASIVFIIFFEQMDVNEIVGVSGFLLICGIATSLIVYQGVVYSKKEKKLLSEELKQKELKIVTETVATIFLVIYLLLSFTTMDWHITWIIWIIYAAVENIIKLLYELGGKKNGK